ncbi:hypothetical protein [Halorientalis pallida]|uniref:Uncharacterized protein n=1 Tax=Halorientalis pallida TaxID=2479928 RepID=A0A498KUT0_9EURY|nr:hypothetical protein [Halorientalis pallida]RXK48319.1 hypothetical protein EAF64_11605 [Halorientalis pallida]
MHACRWARLAGRIGACLLLVSAVTVLATPGAAFGAATVQAQETANGTATNATGNGSQLQTAASDGDDGGGGIVGTLLGLVDGLFGLLGGVVGVLLGFLDSTVGHALVGIPLGIYLGLKIIALYLEYYE